MYTPHTPCLDSKPGLYMYWNIFLILNKKKKTKQKTKKNKKQKKKQKKKKKKT